jgi:hypothetical protein
MPMENGIDYGKVKTLLDSSSYWEFGAMLTSLVGDVSMCLERLKKEPDNQSERRTFIRTFFAFVEGTVFRMKQLALELHEAYGVDFTEAEVAMLREETYDLRENGEVYTQQKFIPLKSNIKFAFKAYSRIFPIWPLKLDERGWEAFRASLEIRNRVTHPKVSANLLISSQDIETLKMAFDWFRDACKDIFQMSL